MRPLFGEYRRPTGRPPRVRRAPAGFPTVAAPGVAVAPAVPIHQLPSLALHVNAAWTTHYTDGASQRVSDVIGVFSQPDPERQPGIWQNAGGTNWVGLVCGFPRRFYDEDGNFIRQTWLPGERYLEATDTVIDWTQPWTLYAACHAGETSDDLLKIAPDEEMPNEQRRWQFRIDVDGRGAGGIYAGGQGEGISAYGYGVSTNPDYLRIGYETRRRFGFCVAYTAPGLSLINHNNVVVAQHPTFMLAPFLVGSKLRLLNGGIQGRGLVLHELAVVTATQSEAQRADVLQQLRSHWGIT